MCKRLFKFTDKKPLEVEVGRHEEKKEKVTEPKATNKEAQVERKKYSQAYAVGVPTRIKFISLALNRYTYKPPSIEARPFFCST